MPAHSRRGGEVGDRQARDRQAQDLEAEGLEAQGLEVRRIQPYQATKVYSCPGCNQDIAVGVGHVVVVPLDAPDLRRHWHHPCWARRATRRPGRSSTRHRPA